MNIFVLSTDPREAARDHCDKHVVKMILEYGQMLSTAHRLLDGKLTVATDDLNRIKPKKFWLLEGEYLEVEERYDEDVGAVYKWVVRNAKMYQVAHVNHPCSVWARENHSNYRWLFDLFEALIAEYARRYGKDHSTSRILPNLFARPRNIPWGNLTPFALAMPEEYKHENAVEAYRHFYVGTKARFAKWKNTPVPDWFKHSMEG